jgi:hypothetical protein
VAARYALGLALPVAVGSEVIKNFKFFDSGLEYVIASP